MTIASTVRKAGPFIGDGVVTALPFAFKVFAAADLLVVQATAGVETTKVLTTDYTVTLNADQDASPGGTVNMLVAAPVGTTTTLASQVAQTQQTDFQNQGGFYPRTHTTSFDKVTILIQQLSEKVGRVLQLPISSTASGSLPAPLANNLLGWDSLGQSIINYAGVASSAVSSAMAPVVAAATTALGRAALGSTTTGDALFTAASAAAARASLAAEYPLGQCLLVKSGANLVLQPSRGNRLTIAGVTQTIPAAGVTLAPTGLPATTLHYIYAYMNGATMTLEASTTGHSTDATTGVEIKTGDASRTLVGMAYVETLATFTDTTAKRYVLSYFNRRAVQSSSAFSTARATASGTSVELNSEIRNGFVTWADEAVGSHFAGSVTLSGAAGTQANTQLSVDSTTAGVGAPVIYNRDTNANIGSASISYPFGLLSEGFHYVTVLGATSGTGASWASNCQLFTTIRG